MARRKNIIEENTVTTETTEPNFDAPSTDDLNDALAEQLQEDAAVDTDTTDYDVDAPEVDAEDVVATQPTAEAEKPAKEKKEPTRPPVPEGKVSPVAYAKIDRKSTRLNSSHVEISYAVFCLKKKKNKKKKT